MLLSIALLNRNYIPESQPHKCIHGKSYGDIFPYILKLIREYYNLLKLLTLANT